MTTRSVLFVCLSLLPALAHAKSFDRASATANEREATITLYADAATEFPKMRIMEGRLRLWFPFMSESAYIDMKGDGDIVRTIRVRPGAGNTGLVEVFFTQPILLTRSDIMVDIQDHRVDLHIARTAWPLNVQEEAKAEVKEEVKAEPKKVVAEKTAALANETTVSKPQAVIASAAEKAVLTKPLAAPVPSALKTLPSWSEPKEASTLPWLKSSTTPGLSVLLLVTGILALGYGLLRTFLGKMSRSKAVRDIDVVSSCRLGPKHQLMLVRALDQQYLLSVNGNQTQRIATFRGGNTGPRKEEMLTAAAKLETLSMATPSNNHATRAYRDQTRRSEIPDFRQELGRLEHIARPSSIPAPASNPIAGLLRLREHVTQ